MLKRYLLAFVLVGSLTSSVVFAADSSVNKNDNDANSINLGVENPGILPTNPFYFIKEWGRGIQRFFTFNPIAKVKLELDIVNQKAAEVKRVNEVNPNNVIAINKALDNYQSAQERLKSNLESLKETSQNPEIDKLLNQAVDRAIRHEAVFNKIAEKFENQAEVKNSVEEINKKIEEITVVIATKDDPIKFISKIKNTLTEIKVNEAQNVKSAEIINRIAEKASGSVKQSLEQFKQDISSVDARVIPVPIIKEELKINIGTVCTKEYNPVCGINGNTYGNSCEAKAAGVQIKYQGKCGEVNSGENSQAACPVLVSISSQVEEKCKATNGKIIIRKNGSGCVIGYECVYENIETNSTVITPATTAVPTVVSSGTTASDLLNVFIAIDESGKFIPQQVKVKKGGKVIWVNKSKLFVWPFSEDYANLDSLRGISNGETYSAIFEKVGVWKYRDYLNSANTGVVEVIE